MKTISQQIAEIEANAKNVLCPELLCAMNQKYNELKNIELDMNELIKKYEIQAEVLLKLMQLQNSTEEEIETASVARRFVTGFIYDLKILKNK